MANITATIQKLNQIKVMLNQNNLAMVGTDYMKSITPIQSGNARRNTRQESNTIHADYPYAERLDHGWSKQFYGELVRPTMEFLEDYVNQVAQGSFTTPTKGSGKATQSLTNKASSKALSNRPGNKPTKTTRKKK